MNRMTMITSTSLNPNGFFSAIRKDDSTVIVTIKDQFTIATVRALRMDDKIFVGINNIFIKFLIQDKIIIRIKMYHK
ncbi:hypothetical protein A9CBEGH2_14200 [Amedibacterium intestinale]|jgi:hypothetical protein|nr:hypothetical protein DW208_11910 [Erysipelotrichaceae bacterium AM17-60]BBK62480.1 hypothetical protein A9CBEGH2_14200 [Amedibacterium intestinale]